MTGDPRAAPDTYRDIELDIFDILKTIKDPERTETLEELGVISEHDVTVRKTCTESNGQDAYFSIHVKFTPTVPHCSLATLIGLCIRTKLQREFPDRFKLDVVLSKGTHATEDEINKQINDKERIAAALENANLKDIVEACINY